MKQSYRFFIILLIAILFIASLLFFSEKYKPTNSQCQKIEAGPYEEDGEDEILDPSKYDDKWRR